MAMFRAITRALIRINGADWSLEQGFDSSLVTYITDSVMGELNIDGTTISALIRDEEEAHTHSLFPFIEGQRNYHPTKYRKHLRNIHKLWTHDKDFNCAVDPTTLVLNDYLPYFSVFSHERH